MMEGNCTTGITPARRTGLARGTQSDTVLWHDPVMQGVDHYENFPVASWLCPAPLRPPIAAIYHFARTADDLADEGSAPASERLRDLDRYRNDLDRTLSDGAAPQLSPWPQVFGPLAQAVVQHRLPGQPLHDLLDAFEQDVRHTADGTRYRDLDELLGYCRRSANPVGRLLLHLYGVNDARSLERSDAICTALQLVNFWQDLGLDLSRRRHYLPQDLIQRYGVDEQALAEGTIATGTPADASARALMAHLVGHARTMMCQGADLALALPGRIGWELRLVVQGGWRILEKIEAMDGRTWLNRPRLRATDAWPMLWRAVRMGHQAPGH